MSVSIKPKPRTKTIHASTKTISRTDYQKTKSELIRALKLIDNLQLKLTESEEKMKTFFDDLKVILDLK